MARSSTKLTVAFVNKIPHPTKGQTYYWDSELRGFGLRVGATKKTYIAQRAIRGRTVRYTIGNHPTFTAETARDEAKDRLRDMAKGVNLNAKKRQDKLRGMTLAQYYADYKAVKELRRNTIKDYDNLIYKTHLKSWANTPLNEITSLMVRKKYVELRETSLASANHAMQLLKAVINFAIIDNPNILVNPVRTLSQQDLWKSVPKRSTWLDEAKLPYWYAALQKLESEVVKDVLTFILYSGLRKNEALGLRWENVDIPNKLFCVPETKNKVPLWLPLNTDLLNLVKKRKKKARKSPWVFPGDDPAKHLVEPRRGIEAIHKMMKAQMAKNKKTEDAARTLHQFGLHDLRRTFITYAERLDMSSYALKRLVNHKFDTTDVTARYIGTDVERLRKPMQAVADEIKKHLFKKSR
ncbi:MAG TPA: integrase family protein [Alphaproteobacteria bacterium]|nr:integrase family protein [Alphaproteobacteria bacterium]